MNVLASKRSWAIVSVACALYVALGVALRLTIKDAVPLVSVIYYATPLPVMAFAATFAGVLWAMLTKRRRALLSFVVGVVCVWWTVQHSYFNNPPLLISPDHCVIFWNVSGADLGWSGIVSTLNSQSPEVIGLVEIGGDGSRATERWQEAFPDYELTDGQGGILLLCKGKIIDDAFGLLGGSGRYKHISIETDDGLLHVFVVDINSDPLRSRRQPVEELAAITSKLGDQPIIVMGDFNTPGDSVHFDVLRSTFVNAFESRGQGYSATWPIPLPVLQLDHIWANRRVGISACKTGWTWNSDHRPIITWTRPN